MYENSFSCNNSNYAVDLSPIDIDEQYKFSKYIKTNYSRDGKLARFMNQATFGLTHKNVMCFHSSEPLDIGITR